MCLANFRMHVGVMTPLEASFIPMHAKVSRDAGARFLSA